MTSRLQRIYKLYIRQGYHSHKGINIVISIVVCRHNALHVSHLYHFLEVRAYTNQNLLQVVTNPTTDILLQLNQYSSQWQQLCILVLSFWCPSAPLTIVSDISASQYYMSNSMQSPIVLKKYCYLCCSFYSWVVFFCYIYCVSHLSHAQPYKYTYME